MLRRFSSPLLLALLLTACRSKPPTTYATTDVDVGTLRETVTATGEVSARIKVNVGSQVSGTVSKLFVDFNSRVKKGDVLAELDSRLFEAQLQRYEASVAVAQAEVEKAKVTMVDTERTLKRYIELAKEKMAAQSDLDAAQVARDGAVAGLKSAEASLLQAQADRNQYRANLTFTKLRSPIDGIVIDRQVDVGQTVAAQFQVATLFTIANDMRQMQVLANIDEADIGKIRPGMPVTFTVDAFPGQAFAGTLNQVRKAPASTTTTSSSSSSSSSSTGTSGQVVTYKAVIDADNPDEKLLQGMTAQVTLIAAERKNAVRLPNAALRYRPKNGIGRDAQASAEDDDTGDERSDSAQSPSDRSNYVTVYVLEHNLPVAKRVHLGIGDGYFVEVLQGLKADDKVIVGDSQGAASAGGSRRGPRGPF